MPNIRPLPESNRLLMGRIEAGSILCYATPEIM